MVEGEEGRPNPSATARPHVEHGVVRNPTVDTRTTLRVTKQAAAHTKVHSEPGRRKSEPLIPLWPVRKTPWAPAMSQR
ncbi:hypothetical protein NDU88_003507 [Pleurodeles waltl]|uniref:Uncharacterized protein n=1 Tax=Pleurodeles waltl TaxID=8319 RepID=A0AAV7RIF0_PLEWA|nr:hypothetical protein NDU88_003507 [Pleurodeles waltl]